MKLLSLAAFLLSLPLFSVAADLTLEEKSKCSPKTPIEKTATVVRTYDGDTVLVKTKSAQYSIRMVGIDTPETHFMGHSQGEWGDRAKEKLSELLPPNTRVRLEFGNSQCDMYGRGLAHIFVGKTHVNFEMAKEGLAANYCVYPSMAHCAEIGQQTKRAMERRIGMFSDPQMELPYDFRRRIKGRPQNSYVGNLKTKEVFKPGNQEMVPVEDRVFFYREDQVQPPFQVAE